MVLEMQTTFRYRSRWQRRDGQWWCTISYPTPPNDTCLRVIDKYAAEFPDVHVGYSGHEEGVAISVAAAAREARVIERHFTVDKSWKGSDHKCSRGG